MGVARWRDSCPHAPTEPEEQLNSPSQEAASDPPTSDSDLAEMDMTGAETEELVACKSDQQEPLPLSAIPGLFDDFDPREFAGAETCDATNFSQGTSRVQPAPTSPPVQSPVIFQPKKPQPSKAPFLKGPKGPKGPKSETSSKPSKAPHLL